MVDESSKKELELTCEIYFYTYVRMSESFYFDTGDGKTNCARINDGSELECLPRCTVSN